MEINNKYMATIYDTPSRPPVVNRLASGSLKDKINIIPDDFEIFINGQPISKINSMIVDYNNKSANINLKMEGDYTCHRNNQDISQNNH